MTRAAVQDPTTLEAWLASRPESVRKLAAEFELGRCIEVRGTKFWIIGYTEADALVISPRHPGEDYDASFAAREHICAEHLR